MCLWISGCGGVGCRGCERIGDDSINLGQDAGYEILYDAWGPGGPDCVPEAEVDVPDALGRDTNCDGIDGDIARAVFVAERGNDLIFQYTGELWTPVRTIAFAIEFARMNGRSQVIVGHGVYRENLTLVPGISVYGGFDDEADWIRDVSDPTLTRIENFAPAMRVEGLTERTVLSGVHVLSLRQWGSGESSVALEVENSTGLVLEDVVLDGGIGGIGASGMPSPVAASPGGAGAPGTPGRYLTNLGAVLNGPGNFNVAQPVAFMCAGNCGPLNWSGPIPAAAGGTNACGCGTGGAGGSPFIPNTPWQNSDWLTIRLDFPLGLGGNATPGTNGSCEPNPLAGIGGAVLADHFGAMSTMYIGGMSVSGTRAPTRGANGVTGTTGVRGLPGGLGVFTPSGYVPAQAGTGGNGTAGSGGAGGGAGTAGVCLATVNGATAYFITATGGGGGAGGSGGCGGIGATGGFGGGASIALFATRSTLHLERVSLRSVEGGEGGLGAPGQYGGNVGPAGLGGAGGQHPSFPSCRGGDGMFGGDGGRGGVGGAGGGGLGGPSVGLYLVGSTVDETSNEISYELGAGGPGGMSGDFAEQAPTGEIIEIVDLPEP